jgi:hypothetical protein
MGGGRAVADALPHIQADPAAILTPADAYIAAGAAGALDALCGRLGALAQPIPFK